MYLLDQILPIRNEEMRIGLLGGSFDPAHYGHVYISNEAIKLLGLRYVIWLVCPQNPLKDLAIWSLDQRVNYAKLITAHVSKIIVSDFERYLPNHYTAKTIAKLQEIYSKVKFTWLMGADNMVQIHQWDDWQSIFESVFVAVFDREEYYHDAITSEASKHFRMCEIDDVKNFRYYSLEPSWYFFKTPIYRLSSTILRDINTMKIENIKNQLQKTSIQEFAQNIEYIKDIILYSLNEDQADDIVILNIEKHSNFAVYMIIVSGRSRRHITAMTQNLMERLKVINVPSSASGLNLSDWVLLDVHNVIVNLFLPEMRTLYNLEELWRDRDILN